MSKVRLVIFETKIAPLSDDVEKNFNHNFENSKFKMKYTKRKHLYSTQKKTKSSLD